MSLRFNQRFKILPGIYLNLGKNGICTTIGPRGASINIGKDGVYLNSGIPGTGISHRQRLSGNKDRPNANTNINIPSKYTLENIPEEMPITTSAGLEGLKEQIEQSKKQREVLGSELAEAKKSLVHAQDKLDRKQNGFFSYFSKKETIEKLQHDVNIRSAAVEELETQYENSRADISVFFEYELEEQYKALYLSFYDLITSKLIWDITRETENIAIKSWAKTSVERHPVTFNIGSLDFIKSAYKPFHFQNVNGNNFFIYPGFVLLFNSVGELTLIDFKDIKLTFQPLKFQETEGVIPQDAKIIEYTWFKVNKNGTRDLRYASNFQIPIVKYGELNFSSRNGLNETYVISNFEYAERFAKEFNKYLRLLNNSTNNNMATSYEFSKQYYDLLIKFSDELTSVTEKLTNDQTIFEKLKINLGEHPWANFISYCVIYDLCQVGKLLNKSNYVKKSLETTGLVLCTNKILKKSSSDLLDVGYESIATSHSKGIYNDLAKSIIEIGNTNKPIFIDLANAKDEEHTSYLNKLQSNLCLPVALKVINHALFDEYATVLYRFASIIAKADNTVSKEEEKILKEIYQITHHPIPEEKNKSLHISEVNKNEPLTEVLKELEDLIGLTDVKQEVKTLINYIKIQKEREKVGLKSSQISYHCVFTGSPGTGKTTLARIIAKIYMHLGVLKKGHLVEIDRSDLVAEYLGQTAVKVNKTVDSAIDGVLFIDEAYSLAGENQDSYGKEAIAALIKRIEDDRDKLIVILAGYTQEMKTFIETNPGFKSRFNRYIEFDDYLPDELEAIFKLQCKKLDYILTSEAEQRLREVVTKAFDNRDKSFGNGRYVRNLFEKTLERQANRIASLPSLTKEILTTVSIEDIPDE